MQLREERALTIRGVRDDAATRRRALTPSKKNDTAPKFLQ